MRLKKDFVSSSLQSSSFSCSRFTVSATDLRTLLPSGIVTWPPPTSTLGMNGVMGKQLSILWAKNIMWLHWLTLTTKQFLNSQCYSQLDGRLVPHRQHGTATQHSDHNA